MSSKVSLMSANNRMVEINNFHSVGPDTRKNSHVPKRQSIPFLDTGKGMETPISRLRKLSQNNSAALTPGKLYKGNNMDMINSASGSTGRVLNPDPSIQALLSKKGSNPQLRNILDIQTVGENSNQTSRRHLVLP